MFQMKSICFIYLFALNKFILGLDDSCQCNQSELNILKQRIERLERYIEDDKVAEHSRRLLLSNEGHPPNPVSFSAYLSHEFAGPTFGTFREIVYDAVETNNGLAYDKFSGTFRAPVSGVYAFTWTIFVEGRPGSLGEIATALIINGAVHGVVHADTETDDDDDSSTGFIIKNLAVGDTVFIRSNNKFAPQGIMMSNSKDGARWTFSGWLLSQ